MQKNNIPLLFITAMALTAVLPLVAIDINKAKEFNNTGMKFYSEKKYKEAAGFFKKAISLYPGYANANYNLACTYALAQQCEFATGEREIFKYLEKSIRLDPAKKEKARKDTDFRAFYNSWNFIKLTETVKTDSEIFAAIVKMKTHKTIRSGMQTSGSEEYSFKSDGSFLYTDTNTRTEPIDNGEFVTINDKRTKSGKFSVTAGKVVLLIKSDVLTREVHGQEDMIKDDYYEKPLREVHSPDKLFAFQDPDAFCGI